MTIIDPAIEKNTKSGVIEQVVKVGNPSGIHLNPATQIAQFAINSKENTFFIRKDTLEVEATSVMGILSLELARDTEVIIKAIGKSIDTVEKEVAKIIQIIEGKED